MQISSSPSISCRPVCASSEMYAMSRPPSRAAYANGLDPSNLADNSERSYEQLHPLDRPIEIRWSQVAGDLHAPIRLLDTFNAEAFARGDLTTAKPCEWSSTFWNEKARYFLNRPRLRHESSVPVCEAF